MMRFLKPSLILILLALSGASCLKKSEACKQKSPSSEADAMLAFATASGITPTTHSSGLMYQIINPGSGATPTLNSTIYITYTGKFLDGTVFDQQTNAAATGWPLAQLIEGWRVGIPLVQKGGQIKLIVPSSMAYGCDGYAAIPANSILYFDITLVNFQ